MTILKNVILDFGIELLIVFFFDFLKYNKSKLLPVSDDFRLTNQTLMIVFQNLKLFKEINCDVYKNFLTVINSEVEGYIYYNLRSLLY